MNSEEYTTLAHTNQPKILPFTTDHKLLQQKPYNKPKTKLDTLNALLTPINYFPYAESQITYSDSFHCCLVIFSLSSTSQHHRSKNTGEKPINRARAGFLFHFTLPPPTINHLFSLFLTLFAVFFLLSFPVFSYHHFLHHLSPSWSLWKNSRWRSKEKNGKSEWDDIGSEGHFFGGLLCSQI